MLPDRLFLAYQRQKLFTITPYDPASQQPVSYDLHLARAALAFAYTRPYMLDLGVENAPTIKTTIPTRDELPLYLLKPFEFLLGCTRERIKLSPRIAAEFMGKSTLGRAGLFVHVTAGLVDPGWGETNDEGNPLTVELFNAGPFSLRLWAGMPIGQLVVHDLGQRVTNPYGSTGLGSHYADDKTVMGSRGFHASKETTPDVYADGSRDATTDRP